MCGLVGILDLTGRKPASTELLKSLADQIQHRGPDGEGFFTDGPAGLGFRRLAIIDLETGSQPMSNTAEDGRYTLVFNGEIYNFQELRGGLEQKGHRFATKSDSEVILHLFEEKKEKCLDDLVGMFALAIWDKRDRRLFLARDRLGKKPLCYGVLEGQFVFASEIKAITRHPAFSAEIDPEALDLYLTYQAVPSPMTIYKNIRRLPPGSYLWVDPKNGPGKPETYWQISYASKFRGTIEDAKTQTLELLREATRARLIADVPLGAFLSGGIDSSGVVAMMAGASERPVKTFTIGFEEKDFSEAQEGRQIARHFGCDHTEFTVRPDMAEVLPKIIWHYDQPFADPSAIPSYYVARETRKRVTVALNGDGGDEAFGGYLRYAADRISIMANQALPKAATSLLAKLGGRLPSQGPKLLQYGRRLAQAMDPDIFETNFRLFCYFDARQKQDLYEPAWASGLSAVVGKDHMERLAQGVGAKNPMDAVFAADYRGYLPDCLLVKMDIATMANSLEARSPFLDHRLVEFAASLPYQWKIRGASTKWILRSALKSILPANILSRRKMGFGAPIGKWIKQEFKDTTRRLLLGPQALKRGYFRQDTIERLIGEHEKGLNNHTNRLWALICFELWNQVYIDKTLRPTDTLPAASALK